MERLKKSILYTDMDGTLIDDKKSVSRANIDAIRHFVALGGKFSVATGRSEVIAAPFLKELPINMPAILYNGAVVYDFASKSFLQMECVDRQTVLTMVRAAMECYPEVCVEVYTDGIIQLLNPEGLMDHYIPAENQPYVYAEPDSCGDCIKLIFYGENARLKEVEKKIYETAGKSCFISTFSAPFYLEILPQNVSKGSALQFIIDHCGENPKDFAAIGDFYNDVAMIEAASLGAAPSNAPEDVKVHAQLVVADNNHNALADLIENYLIEKD